MPSGIRVAIAGVGNCASSLVQGLEYYKDIRAEDDVPGLMHTVVDGYGIQDIQVVCGFDIDERKVGRDVSEAIFAPPNCARKVTDVPHLNAPVYPAPVLDGVSSSMNGQPEKRRFVATEQQPVDVAEKLREHQVDVLVCYLPVGAEKAVAGTMEAALEARVAVVNCVPVFIASNPAWARRFKESGVPILGDDIKSQVGATIVHRVLTKLFEDRGVDLRRTYQLNVGGNTDFLNMRDLDRLKSKKVSKTEAVQSELGVPLAGDDIHIGPSDYVPWMEDNKVCFIRMEGAGFTDVPMELELRLSVQDSANSAGVVIDALRIAKLAMDRGARGAIEGPSAYFFKHPPKQYTDSAARDEVERFILGEKVDVGVPAVARAGKQPDERRA